MASPTFNEGTGRVDARGDRTNVGAGQLCGTVSASGRRRLHTTRPLRVPGECRRQALFEDEQ